MSPADLLDQLMVRGWVIECPVSRVMYDWETQTGLTVDDARALPRWSKVQLAHGPPVRAYFEWQWPTLSGWMWSHKTAELYTDAFERAVLTALSTRTATKTHDSKLRHEKAKNTRARRAAYTESRRMYHEGVRMMRAGHDWKTVK